MQNLYVKRNNRPRRSPGGAPDPIERIDALTRAARGTWLRMIAYLVFACGTLMATPDIEFFLANSQTHLPQIGVSIPTGTFVLLGPILVAAHFIYLHIYLTKLWDALAVAEARPGDPSLSTQITHWLVSDFGLSLRRDGAITLRPFDFLSLWGATFTFVFAASPLVMSYFWVRYWPVHDLWVSLFTGTLFALVLQVALSSLINAASRLRGRSSKIAPLQFVVAWVPSAIIFPAVTFLTIAKTDGPEKLAFLGLPSSVFKEKEGFDLALTRAHLREAVLTELPDNWLSYDTAKRRFWIDWCSFEGLEKEVCGLAVSTGVDIPQDLQSALNVWCDKRTRVEDKSNSAACTTKSAALNRKFESDWVNERLERVQSLPRWSPGNSGDPESRDFRSADFSNAILTGADLGGARLQKAIFHGAQLEGADLSGAQIEGANFSDARMEGADLSQANLEAAVFLRTRMTSASFSKSKLINASFQNARMNEAFLQDADARNADFGGALLYGASFWSADISGASFRAAKMVDTELSFARLVGADLSYAFLGGRKDLTNELMGTDLSAVKNGGGALRFLDLTALATIETTYTRWDASTDFRNAFLDGSVALRPSFQAQMGAPCQWIAENLDDETFFGLWRAWVERAPEGLPWSSVAPSEWRDHSLPQDVVDRYLPPDCQWKTGPMPGAGP